MQQRLVKVLLMSNAKNRDMNVKKHAIKCTNEKARYLSKKIYYTLHILQLWQ